MATRVVHLEGKLRDSVEDMWLPSPYPIRKYSARDFLEMIRRAPGFKVTRPWWQKCPTVSFADVSAKIPLNTTLSFDIVFSLDEGTGTLCQEGIPSFSPRIFDVEGDASLLEKGIRDEAGYGPKRVMPKEPCPPIIIVSSKIAPTYPLAAPVKGIAMFADDYLAVLKSEATRMEKLLGSYSASAPWRKEPASSRPLPTGRELFVKRRTSITPPDTEQDTSTEEADPPLGI